MKYTNKKFTDTLHIYTEGKGKYACVCVRYPQTHDAGFSYNFDIDDAKEFCFYLNNAIKIAEALAQEKDDEE